MQFDSCWGTRGYQLPMPQAADSCPFPETPEANNAVIDATGTLLRDAFAYAHTLGVRTAVGTETPLSTPPPPAWAGLLPLSQFYSASRDDHFLTATDCDECEGLYTYIRTEGACFSSQLPGTVPLSTWYDGVLQDNVLSATGAPGPSYGFVRIECYAYPTPSGSNSSALTLYYDGATLKHYSTATPAGAADATALGFKPLSLTGYVLANMTNVTLPTTQEWYEGIFTRIMAAYDIDTYWIWTPEVCVRARVRACVCARDCVFVDLCLHVRA